MLCGTVDSVGDGVQERLAIGDRVIFDHEGGQDVVIGDHVAPDVADQLLPGTELRVLRVDEIISVVD